MKKNEVVRSICVLLVVMSCSLVPWAQQDKRSSGQHRLELKDIPNLVGTSELFQASDVAISPDGNWVAYTVTSQSLVTRETKQRLWVQPFEGGEAILIGQPDADSSGPDWSPDSSKLLFYSSSKGQTSLAIWSVADKKTRGMNVTPRLVPQWMPDSAGFVVGISGEKQEPNQTHDPKNPTPVVFTSGDTNHHLPGGHYFGLFSVANSANALRFDLVDAASGTAKTVASNVDPNVNHYQLSPDGTRLAYTVNKGEFDYDANKRVLRDIKVVDLQSGSTVLVASDVLGSGFGLVPSWSHDSKMLAVIGGTVEDDSGSLPLGGPMYERPGHCYVIHLNKPGVLHPVGTRSFYRWTKPMWSEDDSSIYALSITDRAGLPRKIIQVHLATGGDQIVATMTGMFDYSISDTQTLDKSSFYLSTSELGGETSRVFVFSFRSHQFTEISEGKYAISSLSVSRVGTRAAYLAGDSSHLSNVWIVDQKEKARPLTHLDLTPEQRQKIGETKSVTWEYNGQTLHGTLWLPAHYREGQRCPTIVDVYPGGQGSSMRNVFRGNPLDELIWPAFSEQGYAVFWPDFFLRVGDGPHEIAAQIVPALDKLVAMGIADPNGFGVHGRSHGGYSTYALITETSRFGAAIPSVGYSNAFTAYGQLDDNSSPYVLGLFENDFLGVSPWQNRELYIKTSPYFDFEKVTTPVLIQYGGQDRPFAWTSREAFVALRRLGKTATLLGYPDEGHGVDKPENQIDFTNRALEWFDRYLKQKSSTQADVQ